MDKIQWLLSIGLRKKGSWRMFSDEFKAKVTLETILG